MPILTTAHFPKAQVMDAMQRGKIGDEFMYAKHERPYDGDPHTMTVGPTSVDIVEPFRRVELRVDEHPDAPYSAALTFIARGQACGLRRGTMKDGHERIWDQSHLFQSGTFNGTFTRNGVTHEVVDWWGQRDHSWGIRDHSRCRLWMWFAIQWEEGMYGVWHWEYPNGARAYTDGCFAPADGSDPSHSSTSATTTSTGSTVTARRSPTEPPTIVKRPPSRGRSTSKWRRSSVSTVRVS